MAISVDTSISQLRKIIGAQSDAELARQLELDKSALTAWRARGRVPAPYQAFLEQFERGERLKDLEVWPELQRAAHRISLLRFTLLRHPQAVSGKVDEAMAAFQSLSPFWMIMYRAAFDLRSKMLALGAELKTAQALVMQDDLRDPSATAKRVAMQLAEDQADNPGLLTFE